MDGASPPSPARPQKRVLIQNGYGDEHAILLDLTRSRHARYCERHGVTYRPRKQAALRGKSPHWAKVDLLLEAMQDGFDQAVWLDTDCLIADMDFDLFTASGFGIAVCECFDSPTEPRHLNTGFMLLTASPDVSAFLVEWRDCGFGGKWEDQSAFIELMKDRPNRDLLTVLPNRFNRVETHMDARDPYVFAFHGDADRIVKISVLLNVLERV